MGEKLTLPAGALFPHRPVTGGLGALFSATHAGASLKAKFLEIT